ncbi:MAG: NFACT RNA binding domain-containing protein [Clostridia bacterium]
MALDGLFLHAISDELSLNLIDAKVDKVYQPASDAIVLSFRSFKNSFKLLISANSAIPRLHFIEKLKENPMSPPMFCMLLRKKLIGARVIEITQLGLERAVKISFEGYDDFGELQNLYIYVEIMGKHSNIILVNNENKIIDSIKRIDLSVSTVRQILPNMTYKNPPSQNKINILDFDFSDNFLDNAQSEIKISKYLLSTFEGFSPLVSKEIAYVVSGNINVTFEELTNHQKDKLIFTLKKIKISLEEKLYKPIMLTNVSTDEPTEFYCFDVIQYGTGVKTVDYKSFSKLLEDYYDKRDTIQILKRKQQEILKVLANAHERLTKKIAIQEKDIKDANEKAICRKYGDILIANLYKLRQGMESIILQDYEDENLSDVEISLVKELSPSKNAQKYFKIYKKSLTTIEEKEKQIKLAKEEINYIDSVFDTLTRVETDKEISEIRQELVNGKYIRENKVPQKAKKSAISNSMEFISSDGFKILVGKNNLQNDNITTKIASKTDLWFHIKDYHGSHTVVLSGNTEVPEQTIKQAAILAATYSKANSNSKVAVDYTMIKNVKKPNGSKPGMVIYVKYQTIYVSSDEKLAEALRIK